MLKKYFTPAYSVRSGLLKVFEDSLHRRKWSTLRCYLYYKDVLTLSCPYHTQVLMSRKMQFEYFDRCVWFKCTWTGL